jgi:uncharacterized membrane protein
MSLAVATAAGTKTDAASWARPSLIAVLLGAVLVRAWGLGVKSLWFDEAYTIFLAQQPLSEIPRLLAAYDTHPPLHYVVLNIWIGIFGSSELAARSLSLLLSVGVVGLTFLLARRFGGDRLGILAAALVALSPFQVTAAQEARMYPLLTLLVLASSYVLWLGVEEGGRRPWVAYAVLTALALYTHHFGFLVVAAHAVFVLSSATPTARRAWGVALLAAAVLYLPLLPMLYAQFFTARAWPDLRPPFGAGQFTDLLGMLSFGGGILGMGSYFSSGAQRLEARIPVLLPFALLIAFGIIGLRNRRARALAVLQAFAPIAAISLLSLRWNLYYARYFSFTLPAFAILLAAGVFAVADAVRTHRVTALAATLAVVASFLLPSLAEVYRTRAQFDWRAMAAHVSARARPDDFILFIPAFARIPFEYYFRGPQRRMSLNPEALIRRGVRASASDPTYRHVLFAAQADPEKMEAIARAHPRMWIVATVPIGLEARKQIAARLAPYFREVDGRGFGYVYAFLWESRVYRTPP